MKRLDLFNSTPRKSRRKSRPTRRPRAERTSWRDPLPWATTPARGVPYSDPVRTEEMLLALCGENWGADGERLAAVVSEEIGASRMLLRVWELRASSPDRDPEGGQLSGRGAQLVRRILRRSDARGVALPFKATVRHPRWTERSPLAHGHLTPTGMTMATPRENRVVRDWPTPVPLVVGPSPSPVASWTHLAATSALAVWSGPHLWLFRCVERFPSVFDVLRGLRPDSDHHTTN